MSRYLIAMSLAAIFAAGPLAARSAHAAQTPSDQPSEAVQIYGWELSSSAGIARVHGRLEDAARDVCHGFDSKELARKALYRRCVADTLERAVRDVHDARLSAYHRAKTGATRTVAIVAGSPAAAR